MKTAVKKVFTVFRLEELPIETTFYVIATEASYITDDGWPGNDHTCSYVQLEVYRHEQEWKDAVKIYTQFKRGAFRAFVMTPPIVTNTTTVDVPKDA